MTLRTLHAGAALAVALAATPASAGGPAKAAGAPPAQAGAIDAAQLKQAKRQFAKMKALPEPVQASAADLVVTGHGGYAFKGETRVPEGLELWVLGPPGSALSAETARALWRGEKLSKLGLLSRKTMELAPTKPIVYKAGESVPNYQVNRFDVKVGQSKPRVIVVDAPTTLEALWPRVQAQAKKGKTVRVFWAACTVLQGSSREERPLVVHP